MTNINTEDLEEGLVKIAKEAGNIILADYNNPDIVIHTKKDGSPVTDTDPKAENKIIEKLGMLTPDIPVVGEEITSAGQAPDVSNAKYFWLVDALDGTQSFIRGRRGREGEQKSPEFTVNIALIKDGEPILGVVYAPALDEPELFLGNVETGKSFLEKAGKREELQSQPVDLNNVKAISNYKDTDYPFSGNNLKVIRMASSIKFARIAQGVGDAYKLSSHGMCEWDVAAGDAILRSLGGGLVNKGTLITYGKAPSYDVEKDVVAYRNPAYYHYAEDQKCQPSNPDRENLGEQKVR